MWGVKSALLWYILDPTTQHLVVVIVFPCCLPFILSLENVKCSAEYWSCAKLSAGYNTVVRIPAGTTSLDVRQHSFSGKSEDDNYLGKNRVPDMDMNSESWVSFQSSRYSPLPSSVVCDKLPSIKEDDLEIHYLISSPEYHLRILTQGLHCCSIQ